MVEHQAALLALPRELRDLIYYHVLQDRAALGTAAHSTKSNGQRLQKRVGLSFRDIYYPIKPPKHPILQLQLCNEQLCEETREVLQQFRPRDTVAGHLDVLCLDGKLWPTWTSLPVISVLEQLGPYIEINLRIPNHNTEDWGSGFRDGPAYIALWILLNQLVHNGPFFNRELPLARPLAIDNIRINLFVGSPCQQSDDFALECVLPRIRQLAIRGVGYGKIKSIGVHYLREWVCKVLPPTTTRGVIEAWARLGFQWESEWRWTAEDGQLLYS